MPTCGMCGIVEGMLWVGWAEILRLWERSTQVPGGCECRGPSSCEPLGGGQQSS